jgi:uncharacterized protein (TIGR00369 family)
LAKSPLASGGLPRDPHCLVCGRDDTNPWALGLQFRVVDGEVVADVRTHAHQSGYPGVLHGGAVAGILDEAMGWAATHNLKQYVMTGELKVRYLKPVPVDTQLQVRARVCENLERCVIAEGSLYLADGTLLARASGKFALATAAHAAAVREVLEHAPDDIDMVVE